MITNFNGAEGSGFFAEGGLGHIAAHGITGGVTSVLQGGKFGHGFLSAGLTKALNINNIVGTAAKDAGLRVAMAAVVGGTISKLTGGKFANGAVTAAFAQAFNGNSQAAKIQARKDFLAKYGDILKVGNIDIDQNVKDAKNMSLKEWKAKVQTGGDWDYKNDSVFAGSGIDAARLDEFGNVHFGIVANAFGFNLEGSMYGAGAYQVLVQGGGNAADLAVATRMLKSSAGGYLLPDAYSRYVTNNGFTWGDNPGDAINIMNGWDHAETVYGN
ncbi:polymorphic toxin type 44 domain-containing protein [Shewanella indica]|nr:polymorphic toxin type 44 domain-containing protein [Shewanella indica]MCE9793116.1 polymorphic toxin type 44 domain-containing protein [Shewanella indica]